MHVLRTSPCVGNIILNDIDATLRNCVTRTFNVQMSDDQWLQASFPVNKGGLGIRTATSLAPSAFSSSSAATSVLQSMILNDRFMETTISEIQAHTAWKSLSNIDTPSGIEAYRQKSWDKPVVEALFNDLLSNLSSDREKSRLLAISAPKASAWLHALPISSCGLRLDNEAIRVAISLRLGTTLCMPHACPCGSEVDAIGSHMLSCKKSGARICRHSAINDEITRSLIKAGFPSIKEPVGLLRNDGKRPDGVTQIPWASGKNLTWDVTVCDTLASSYTSLSSVSAGLVAERAASLKLDKYSQLTSSFQFVPVAFETLGPINKEGLSFLQNLGKKISIITGDPRESSFLLQRLSIILQRFNSVSLKDSFPVALSEAHHSNCL